MNKIILIGNGFDLAHGLKTSYKDFINDFWKQKASLFQERYKDKKLLGHTQGRISISGNTYKDDDITIENIYYYSNVSFAENNSKEGFEYFKYSLSCIDEELEKNIVFDNKFLKQITNNLSLTNWVDIESEYYIALNECLKKEIEDEPEDRVEKLNKDFFLVKNALKKYLAKQENDKESTKILNKLNSIIDPLGTRLSLNPVLDNNILFLIFNYTNTSYSYVYIFSKYFPDKISYIYIHGELNNQINHIVFGYGDEIDEKYKIIENKNNNRYLENVKSIMYMERDNYKRLLEFIDSEEYEIFIMGHSCGISDRTLLNTLFEHEKCHSIKVFYHKEKDNTDNYSDVIRNISRNFTDKALFRKIVVDKTNCVPLS